MHSGKIFQQDLEDYRARFEELESARGKSFDDFLQDLRADQWFDRTNKLLLQGAIALPRTTNAIVNFTWTVIEFRPPTHLLLTSDRPLIMTNGIGRIDGHVALSIGPRKLFLAGRDRETVNRIQNFHRLPQVVNDLVVKQARQEVYAFSNEQSKFVDARLGRRMR